MPRDWLAACLVLLVLAAALPYLFSLRAEFVLDDRMMILRDDSVHSLRGIPAAFTKGFLSGIDEKPYYYRPLVTASYALNYAMFGQNPLGYKLTNLLLHVLVTVLVFALARRVLATDSAALASGLIFAVHPAHTEAVAWISARTELLAALFGLASVLAFLRYVGEGRRGWYAASVAFFLAGILSKENVLVLPLLLAALAWLRRPRPGWRRVCAELIPFAVVALAYLGVRQVVLGYMLSQTRGPHLEMRLLLAGVAILEYLRILVFAGRAEPLYDIFGPAIRSPAIAVAAWVGVVGLAAAAIAIRRRWAAAAFAAAWTLVAILPVTNIVPIPNPIPVERFLYLPSVGFSILFGMAAGWLLGLCPQGLRSAWRPVSVGVICGVLAYCGLQTYAAAPLWSNDAALVSRMVQRVPRYGDIHKLAGAVYRSRGDDARAVAEYRAAARILPNDPEPVRALALLYRRVGDAGAGAREARKLVRLVPGDASAYNLLGGALAAAGDLPGAIRAFGQAAKLAPGDPVIRFNLARACVRNRKYTRAVEQYREGLRLRPDDERAKSELAAALAALKGRP